MSTDVIAVDVSPNPAEAPKTASTLYLPLPHDGDSFRLLRVLPSLRFSSPLRCELYTTSISREEDQYIAGSYVWGPPEPTETILLDGTPFQVRKNLFCFLRVFRSRYRSQIIWVDAVCINQDDVQERGHQVQEMKRIYSGAKCVYCWLGYDKPLPHTSIFGQQRITDMYYRWKRDKRQHTRQKYQLLYIAQAEYWSRIWIVQEFILAKDITLLIGKDKIFYHKLCSIPKDGLFFDRSDRRILQTKMLTLIRYRAGSWWPFEYLFRAFGMLPCSVPQDGVFALLGLIGHNEGYLELTGMIDYSLTVWQLLQRILASNILENPFQFAARYNRYVIKGQGDEYMQVLVNVELKHNLYWLRRDPQIVRYPIDDASSLHMAMAMRASRAVKPSEATDTDIIEFAVYTQKWPVVPGQTGVSLRLSIGPLPLPDVLDACSTYILAEDCDLRCNTTCATHAVIGFAWKFYSWGSQCAEPTTPIPIDVSPFTQNTLDGVSGTLRRVWQRVTDISQHIGKRVRVVKDESGQCSLETNLETMVKLSAFVTEVEYYTPWSIFLNFVMEQSQKSGADDDVASRVAFLLEQKLFLY